MEAATGSSGKDTDAREVEMIVEYFKVCLECEDVRDVELTDLVQVIEPECPVEQIAHRRAITSFGSTLFKPFATKNIYREANVADLAKNDKIGFRSRHYVVAQQAGSVGLVLEKRTGEELSFWV